MRELDDNGGVPHVLRQLGVLYGLWSLEKHMGLLCKGKIKRRETETERRGRETVEPLCLCLNE